MPLQLIPTDQLTEDMLQKIKLMVAGTLPEPESVNIDNLTHHLKSGRANVWVLNREGQFLGCVITTIILHILEDTATFQIHSAFGVETATAQELKEAFALLMRAARTMKCSGISFFTQDPRILNWMTNLKAHVNNYVFVPV